MWVWHVVVCFGSVRGWCVRLMCVFVFVDALVRRGKAEKKPARIEGGGGKWKGVEEQKLFPARESGNLGSCNPVERGRDVWKAR